VPHRTTGSPPAGTTAAQKLACDSNRKSFARVLCRE
jgi:hypothetical protein